VLLRTFLIAYALACGTATAQDAGVTQTGNVTTYDALFFGPFKPITAEDILTRIPGIQQLITAADVEKDQRGFGSAGDQILFNGRRLSSKSMTVASALRRIRASQVLHVDVIRGDAAGMDVRSDGILINVVLAESITAGAGTWEGRVSYFTDDVIKYGGKLSYAGDIGALSYVAGIEVTPHIEGRRRDSRVFVPVGPRLEVIPATAPYDRQFERYDIDRTEYIGSASVAYTFGNGDILNANGRLLLEREREDNALTTFALNGDTQTFTRESANKRVYDTTEYEVGADYQHAFAGGDTFKLLGIYTRANEDDARQFFLRTATQNTGRTRTQSIFPRGSEKIVRGTWRTTFNPQHSLEAGGEVALNALASRIERLDDIGGAQVPFNLFNPTGKVSETRAETFTTWSWRPTEVWSIDVAADTEVSKFKQRGRDVSSDQSFFFVKPRIDVRMNVAPRNQVRLRLQRTVSQLNFIDFLPGFNTEPNRVDVIRAGNPNLVPEKRWIYDAVYEYRLPEDQGVISLRGTYVAITDFIEQIPVDTSVVAANGNIGPAHDWDIELKAGLRLGFIGLPNATLDISLQKRESRVTDPFDGRKRGFQRAQTGNWEVDFRHDTDWHNFAYGFTVANRAVHYSNEPDSFGVFNSPRTTSAFAEIKLAGEVQLRLEGTRLGDHPAKSERYVFAGRRGLTNLLRSERAGIRFPSEVRLSLRGTF